MKLNKSYIYLWLSAIIVLILNWWNLNNDLESAMSSREDLIENTYFFEHSYSFIIWTTLFLSVLGIIYWVNDKLNLKLNKILTWIHIIISILGTLLMIFLPRFFYLKMTAGFENGTIILEIIGYSILIAQILFIINIIIGIFKKNNKPVANNMYN